MSPRAAFRKAVKTVGGTSEMARRLKRLRPRQNYTPSRISNWLKRGMPEKEAIHVEAVALDEKGRQQVSKEDLAPELYPRPKLRNGSASSSAHA